MLLFLSATWLAHGQLWGTVSFTNLMLITAFFIRFDLKITGSLLQGWVPKPG